MKKRVKRIKVLVGLRSSTTGVRMKIAYSDGVSVQTLTESTTRSETFESLVPKIASFTSEILADVRKLTYNTSLIALRDSCVFGATFNDLHLCADCLDIMKKTCLKNSMEMTVISLPGEEFEYPQIDVKKYYV